MINVNNTSKLLQKWDRKIVGTGHELEVLEQHQNHVPLFKAVLLDKERRSSLFDKFQGQAHVMRLIWMACASTRTSEVVWDQEIVERNQEIQILSLVNEPDRLRKHTQRLIRNVPRFTKLADKFKNNHEAFPIILQVCDRSLTMLRMLWLVDHDFTRRITIWDHIVPRDLEIRFLSRFDVHNKESRKGLKAVLHEENRGAALLQKHGHVPLSRSTINQFYLGTWDEVVVADREIEFLENYLAAHDQDSGHLLRAVIWDTQRRSALFDKYCEQPNVISLIWQGINAGDLREIVWDREIVRLNLEVLLVKNNEEPSGVPLSSVLSEDNNKRGNALVEKYKNNPEALAVIWKGTGARWYGDIWERIIVPQNFEITFLSLVDRPGFARLLQVRGFMLRNETRLTNLIVKYKNNPDALRIILHVYYGSMLTMKILWLLNNHEERIQMWDREVVTERVEFKFISYLIKDNKELFEAVKLVLLTGNRETALMEKYKDEPEKLKQLQELLNEK